MSRANAAAWSWVLKHHDTIERMARKRARETRTDPDDVRNEAALYLVGRHADFDPSKGSAKTWIWYAVKYAATKINRQRFGGDKTTQRDVESMDDLTYPETVEDIDQKVLIGQLIDAADDPQRDAIASVLNGWTGDEIRAQLNVSTHGRNMRLYRLRATLEKVT